MNFSGAWFNEDYSGEGLSITEYPPDKTYPGGYIAGYMFTYQNDGSPLWLQCLGERDGNRAVLDVTTCSGGKMNDKAALKNVIEKPWGSLVLLESGDVIKATFMRDDGVDVTYDVQPLYVPKVDVSATVKTEIWQGTIQGGSWIDVGMFPLISPPPEYPASKLGKSTRIPPDIRFTVLQGTLTISAVGTNKIHGAKMTLEKDGVAMAVGSRAETGESVIVKIYLGPLDHPIGSGQWEIVPFSFSSVEHGTVMRTGVQILG